MCTISRVQANDALTSRSFVGRDWVSTLIVCAEKPLPISCGRSSPTSLFVHSILLMKSRLTESTNRVFACFFGRLCSCLVPLIWMVTTDHHKWLDFVTVDVSVLWPNSCGGG